jgi:hypothetical protein
MKIDWLGKISTYILFNILRGAMLANCEEQEAKKETQIVYAAIFFH